MLETHRARRALRGRLRAGEEVESAASDAITGDRWVLTDQRLLVLRGAEIATELSRVELAGELRDGAAGTEVRLRGAGGALHIGNFRGRNLLVASLVGLLAQPPSE